MNYIALRNRFSNPLLSYLVLISSSFRSRSKTKISTLKVNLKLFLCHWKLAPFGERIEVMLSGFYVMSFWLHLFVCFVWVLFLCVCRNSWTHYQEFCYLCLFWLNWLFFSIIIIITLQEPNVSILIRLRRFKRFSFIKTRITFWAFSL